MAEEGASHNERLLYAARNDDVDILDEVFAEPEKFNVNFQDGLGNTALHYAASHGSLDVLNELLEHEDCDVDYINYLEGATPLHLAVKIEEPALRALIVDSLLDAGADSRIKDKAGQVAIDYVPEGDAETRNAFRRQQAVLSMSPDDIADDDDDDGDEDSYSESDDED